MPQAREDNESGKGPLNPTQQVLAALGANLDSVAGPPRATLLAAIEMLAAAGLVIRAVSPFYRTPAFPAGSGPDYVNAALVIETAMTPQQVLAQFHEIEASMGRERVQRWGQRTLDIDLLAFDDHVLPEIAEFRRWQTLLPSEQVAQTPDQLILPHPRIQDRAFVLVPLADIAPDWLHPVLDQTIQQLLDRIPQAEKDEVQMLESAL